MMKFCKYLALAACSWALAACDSDDVLDGLGNVPPASDAKLPSRLFVLCEGLMGGNTANLEYLDADSSIYYANAYVKANPGTVLELGDVGNDLQYYGGKLWAVINGSNKVEVVDAATLKRKGQAEVPNGRQVAFDGGFAYVTSYAGPIVDAATGERRGYVAKIDTATLAVVETRHVGRQPEGIVALGGKLYVANSGGYCTPAYEQTLSVIDLASFRREREVTVAMNMQHIRADRHGRLWVSSIGNYADVPPTLCCYDTASGKVEQLDVPVGAMTLQGDSLYIVSSTWDFALQRSIPASAIVNVATREVVSRSMVDAACLETMVPYGVAVDAQTHDIFVSDARDYVSPGLLYRFAADGTLKSKVSTGNVPGHLLFVE